MKNPILRTAGFSLLAMTALTASESSPGAPRLLGELLIGTAGAELGVAAEWDFAWSDGGKVRLRPEVLLNGFMPGVAVSGTLPVAGGSLPENQELWIGPRLVFHNDRYNGGRYDDDLRYGFGAEVVAFYTFGIVPSQPGRHTVQAIGAIGVVDHRDDLDPSVTFGAAYGYQF